ncbi:MAG: antibiotic biosynthesis monooxygenase [Muribaculaceae bacterium]|nr:antibiotic biosynthesis monooxygenase [Muribaculaceae bacterium]MDE6753616.1 antibiotic biosynthesis monooxygenase [Muribaculaceae bacterium]
MIRLNVSMIVETEDDKKHLVEAATELVAFSLREKGCISYDLYQSKTNDDRFMIIETWNSAEDLKAHSESEHYKRLSPELQKYSNLTVEKFDF